MTKAKVEEQCLSAYVVMPAVLEVAFKEWWQSLKSSDVITIWYPHACHGNAGMKSNFSKMSVMEDFLDFVDVNSQPNGRSADSSGPTFYFLPTLQTPKSTSAHYEQHLKALNSATQCEKGRGECSNGSCHNC